MRATMTISLPEKVKKQLLARAKKEQRSVSAIIMQALKHEESLISEEEVLSHGKQAKKDYLAGKAKSLRNLTDLMN